MKRERKSQFPKRKKKKERKTKKETWIWTTDVYVLAKGVREGGRGVRGAGCWVPGPLVDQIDWIVV